MDSLGIRTDCPLTAEQAARLSALATFDLTAIRDRLRRDERIPPEWIDASILEFRRYVGLSVLGYRELGMYSVAIDEVWHTTLLFTRLYADLCDTVFGHFMHHAPADGHEAGEETYRAGYLRFKEAYERTYGPLADAWRVKWTSV